MKFREFLLALIAMALAACTTPPTSNHPQADAPTPGLPGPPNIGSGQPSTRTPVIRAESAIVIDMVSGRILYEKNARSQRAVASTQKLLTALVAIRSGSLKDPVTIAQSDTLVEPSKLYVKAGETYTREALVKALLVKSGNDIALSLARDISGSKEAFAARMNSTARSLGMNQSNFVNPHGLTEPGQYSTALDIAILAREVQKQPFLRDCMRTKSYTFTYADGRTRLLKNTNKVLTRLPYCTGMKTGTTNASGRCLVSSGIYNGKGVIAVVLKSNSANVWTDSEKLLRWALE